MAEARQKSSKDKGGQSQAAPDDVESKRLRDRAVSKGSLARAKASPADSLSASKAILRCNGKDIVKRGHRKNKYLFSFPGLLAPVAGGQLGELAQLDTKNPVMYFSFPEGRLKLFGTLVYPKNKYLTLHFSKGAGNIACEDCFENMVVFSEYWWIGSKEENPNEERLDMPESLTKRSLHEGVDFSGGAARQPDTTAKAHPEATASKPAEPDPDDQEEEGGTAGPDALDSEAEIARTAQDDQKGAAARRKSSRTAGRSFRFAEPRTDDELDDDADSDSDDVPLRPPSAKPAVSRPPKEKPASAAASKAPKKRPVTINLDSDDEGENGTPETEAQTQAPPRSKRKATSAAKAPAGKKAKKGRKEEDEDAGEGSSEDIPTEPSDDDDSDEEWKL
ncbi:hypothetical protein KFL_001340030 [Klebsormidium nitens]|uniref:DNA-binding protein RHL1 n=1 Tax=Klebsormidium nitens TaxID=105231 RepID=A0A1Y1I0T0_KLENI|nr:hypothetical protein KFL_001340030 [Klebsormidium nitens]|eukprot:GAQ83049.1 hypothetical protein KFL_001340030 [Klebsormidium nitens]